MINEEGRTARPPRALTGERELSSSRASLGRVEGGDGIVEDRNVADVRPQPSGTHRWTISLSWARSDRTTKSTVKPSAGRASVGPAMVTSVPPARIRPCGSLPDVAADDIEHQIDSADVFEDVVLEVDELLRAEVERVLTVGSASGADDVGAELTCELRHHRTDCAGRAVHEDALPRLKAAVHEQSLPRGQARHRHGLTVLNEIHVSRPKPIRPRSAPVPARRTHLA